MKTYLVTGGAGFIGSALALRLAAAGARVVVVDNCSSGSPANLAGASELEGEVVLHELDICSPGLHELVHDAAPEVIFHLAAQVDVRASVADPAHDASVNVLGTIALLQAASALEVPPRFVLAASGGTLYGAVDEALLPIAETASARPLSPYGISKRAAIDYLESYRQLHDVSGCALALANVYGPRQARSGEAAVVTAFVEAIMAGSPLTIFGDGSQTRDLVFVEDVVDAFLLAADADTSATSPLIYNVGTGTETSVLELAGALLAAARCDLEIVHRPERLGELKRNSLDPSRAGAILGWRPTTSLGDGLARTLEARRAEASG